MVPDTEIYVQLFNLQNVIAGSLHGRNVFAIYTGLLFQSS